MLAQVYFTNKSPLWSEQSVLGHYTHRSQHYPPPPLLKDYLLQVRHSVSTSSAKLHLLIDSLYDQILKTLYTNVPCIQREKTKTKKKFLFVCF